MEHAERLVGVVGVLILVATVEKNIWYSKGNKQKKMLKKIYKYTRSLDLYLLLCTVRISLSSSFPIHNSIWMNEWMNECLRSINLKILVWISSSSSSVHHPLSSLCGLFRCYTLYSIRLFSYGLATTLCIVDLSRAKWRRRRRGRRSNNTTYFLSTTDWQHARQITHLVRSIHDTERVCLCMCVCVYPTK